MNRRKFLESAAIFGVAGLAGNPIRGESGPSKHGVAGGIKGFSELSTRLRAARRQRFLRTEGIKDPIILKSLRVLTRDGQYFIEARDKDGAVGLAMGNRSRLGQSYTITSKRLAKFYVGKDMRNYEDHLDALWVHDSTYKWQGLPLWVNVAGCELAILDLIGKKTGQPVHALLGDKVRDKVGLYYANGDRNHSAQWVVDKLREDVAESGARAVKFKVGARMAMTQKSNARDKRLIPLMREAFGPEMVIYADANSSYDVPTAVYFGRMMEENSFGFFEEPVPFDYLEETKAVADALDIPIAGGEQESSLWNFEWLLANKALQVVQPDLIYFGGLIRSLRVAAMARELGLACVPHISGPGLGSLYMAQFVSIIPNTTDYQEYKGDPDPVPYQLTGTGKRLKAVDGKLPVPDGPGLGIEIDPGYLAGMQLAPA
ncbi:MAG: mandelate racemase/muconate lactonizing enzyme family protein [Puniceicoccaceae bacterium]